MTGWVFLHTKYGAKLVNLTNAVGIRSAFGSPTNVVVEFIGGGEQEVTESWDYFKPLLLPPSD